jgi:hypothetical protein
LVPEFVHAPALRVEYKFIIVVDVAGTTSHLELGETTAPLFRARVIVPSRLVMCDAEAAGRVMVKDVLLLVPLT